MIQFEVYKKTRWELKAGGQKKVDYVFIFKYLYIQRKMNNMSDICTEAEYKVQISM